MSRLAPERPGGPLPACPATGLEDVPPFTEGDGGLEFLAEQTAELGERYEKASTTKRAADGSLRSREWPV